MYAEPLITNELFHAPLGPSAGVPAVDVCAAESLLTNVTVSPAEIDTVDGMKQFGSHPGVDEPGAFSTVAANALGTISPIMATARIEKSRNFNKYSG